MHAPRGDGARDCRPTSPDAVIGFRLRWTLSGTQGRDAEAILSELMQKSISLARLNGIGYVTRLRKRSTVVMSLKHRTFADPATCCAVYGELAGRPAADITKAAGMVIKTRIGDVHIEVEASRSAQVPIAVCS